MVWRCKLFASCGTYAQNVRARHFGRIGSCYKSSSGYKLLIFNGLPDCRFSGHLSQALDFPGLAGQRSQTINKVIHTICSTAAKLIQINDLSGVSEIDLNIRA
jgi:hypothetical protein